MTDLAEARRQLQAVRAGMAAIVAADRIRQRVKLNHVCPLCLEDMPQTEYRAVSVYRCRPCRFYRQVARDFG